MSRLERGRMGVPFAAIVREDVEAIERNLDTEDEMSDETTLADVQRWCEAHRADKLRMYTCGQRWIVEALLTIEGSRYAVPRNGSGPTLADAWASLVHDVEGGAR